MIVRGFNNYGYKVVCEKCGGVHHQWLPSISIATNRAAASGWRRKNGKVYCPKCYQDIERYNRNEL